MTDFHPLRWLVVFLLSLLWATMGSAAASAKCGDFGCSSLAAKRGGLFSHVGTGPRATPELIEAVGSKGGRSVTFTREGSEELRYLDYMGAEANVGGAGHTHILLRENPSKAAVLEEFL
jgi:hypothetical protein